MYKTLFIVNAILTALAVIVGIVAFFFIGNLAVGTICTLLFAGFAWLGVWLLNKS